MPTALRREPYKRLSRDRVLRAATQVADRGGVKAITIRRVAQELDVEAMSLYHHVPNKEAMVDGVVDPVFTAIPLPADGLECREATRVRARSTRAVLAKHRWALELMDSRRSPGPATLHHDALLGVLRKAGSPLDDLQEVAGGILEHLPAHELPHLRELVVDHALQPGYDCSSEFDYGLDLVLDALEARPT
nr:TetR/AcrR family transcriptional regulator C-terminal domain-containing protein [Ornithinimicrobium sediminis]